MSDAAAAAAPNAHAQAMNEMIESVHKAEAEVNRLKRKYAPDEPEVLLNTIVRMHDDRDTTYMRVEIFTGASMMLTLTPHTRNNGNLPDWKFMPPIEGKHDNMEHIVEFGTYQVYVGNGHDGHELLVTFDHKGVRIRAIDTSMFSGDLTMYVLPSIDEGKPEFALTHGDSA
jgi:hypothetical protein